MTVQDGFAPLAEIQQAQFENSVRWFPKLHEQSFSWLILFQATGFAEEAGEVLGGIKKAARHMAEHGCEGDGVVCPERERLLDKARDEVADPLAYLLNLCVLLEVDLGSTWAKKTAFNETRVWEGVTR